MTDTIWLTIAEASTVIGIPERTLRHWISIGHIPPRDVRRVGERLLQVRKSALRGLEKPMRGNPNWRKDNDA